MRALHAYAKNDPSRLVVEDAPLPTLGPGDVLVRVHASGVSPGELDWNGTWLRDDGAGRMPPIIPGHEVSGVVEKVGAGAAGIEVGDEVFGVIDFRRDGADADFVAVRADELVPKPPTATHAEAAAVPLSALTAWQALFDQGDLAPGHRVLVHGGGGGVGSFAVQLARWRGAHVTATSSARDADLVRGLGADDVIDYRTQRFEDEVANLDLVFDTVGGDTWERSWDVLGPRGRLVSIAVPRPRERATDDDRRAIWFIVKQDREQLREIGGLIDAGHLRPIVSAELPLIRGQEAYGPTGIRSGPGKVVLLVAGASGTELEDLSTARPTRRATPNAELATVRRQSDRGTAMNIDVLRRVRDPDPGMAAEVDLEASRWAEITALVDLLTPDERTAPGYFVNPDWSVKDLVAHLGWWHAEARSELLKIATRTYEPHDFEIDRRNAETLAARKSEPWDLVWSQATAARVWMLEAWFGLGGRSTAANQWVRKAGAEHYGEHLDPLRAWTAELIDLRTRPRVDERDP